MLRKILFIAFLISTIGFIISGVKLGVLLNRYLQYTLNDPIEYIRYNYDPWRNYKLESRDEIDKDYPFLYDILSAEPLPEEAQIKEFEYKATDYVGLHHAYKSYVRIWLELPDDENLIKETLDILSVPITDTFFVGNKSASVEEQLQSEFGRTDSGVLIEAVRLIDINLWDVSLPNGDSISYVKLSNEELSSDYGRRILNGEIYQAYMAQEELKDNLVGAVIINLAAVLILLGIITGDYLSKNAQS